MGLEPELLSSNARLNCAMSRDAKQANKENLGRILIFWRAPAVRPIIYTITLLRLHVHRIVNLLWSWQIIISRHLLHLTWENCTVNRYHRFPVFCLSRATLWSSSGPVKKGCFRLRHVHHMHCWLRHLYVNRVLIQRFPLLVPIDTTWSPSATFHCERVRKMPDLIPIDISIRTNRIPGLLILMI